MMTVDSSEKVAAVEFKNEEARQVFADLSLIGKNVDEALRIVTDTLQKSGFLNNDDQVQFILQPAEGVRKEALSSISEKIQSTLKEEIETKMLQAEVRIVVLENSNLKTNELAQASAINTDAPKIQVLSAAATTATSNTDTFNINDPKTWNRAITDAYADLLAAGFNEAEALDIINKASLVNPLPRETYEIASGFVDMKDAGIPYAESRNIFKMGQELEPNVFRKEISTLISDLIDMNEVGISSETGLKALVMAIAADRTLREVSTIISGIIDLKASGVPESELLTRTAQAIEADPTLRRFDDLLGIKDDYDDNEDNDYDDDYEKRDNNADDDGDYDNGDRNDDDDDDNDEDDEDNDEDDDDR
jgi:hypothetical protein